MIHQYKNNGYDIIMDINSGAVHVVDDILYDAVKVLDENEEFKEIIKGDFTDSYKEKFSDEIKNNLKDKYSHDDLCEAIGEIYGLIDDETLFSKDLYEGIVENLPSMQTVVKALCLHVTHDCNLACKYFRSTPAA